MKPETRELVRYRLRRAYETLEEAKILLRQGKLEGAANRVYYGMF